MLASITANQFIMVANEIQFCMRNSTEETWEKDRDEMLERLGLTAELGHMTFG